MKKDIARFGMVVVIIILVAVFIHPTLYHYDNVNLNGNVYPIKENRITVKVYYYDPFIGWRLSGE